MSDVVARSRVYIEELSKECERRELDSYTVGCWLHLRTENRDHTTIFILFYCIKLDFKKKHGILERRSSWKTPNSRYKKKRRNHEWRISDS